jgi:hypothetical protein
MSKYIGLDVHQASISVAVVEESGKLTMQSAVATRAASLLEFLDRTARYAACHLRRRDLFKVALRFAGRASEPSGGVQSQEECSAQEGEQE